MCEKCHARFELIIEAAKTITIEGYKTVFGIKKNEELKPKDYDVMIAIHLAVAGDYADLANPSEDPMKRILEMLGKSRGAHGAMFIGGPFPTLGELGVEKLTQIGDIGYGVIPRPKKEDLQ